MGGGGKKKVLFPPSVAVGSLLDAEAVSSSTILLYSSRA